jgi:HD-like signal output (HDOD) protein
MYEPDLGNGINAAARQRKLDDCVQRISLLEGVPPFGRHANELIAQTLDLGGSNSGKLARVALKDLGLTSQILRMANSALYNHSGRPITSVPHGIVMIGWDTLRDLIGTVRYVEHFAKRSPGLRELMLMSMLSAVHSRDIAASIGYPRPEEAHLCGLFRNLGEVLIACHLPDEYSRIILIMNEESLTETGASVRVLGFSWDEVGSRVAANWDMPPKIDMCLRGWDEIAGSRLDRCLASITDYARNLTHAIYRDGAAIDVMHQRWVVDLRGRQAPVPVNDLRRLADSALKETKETFMALGISGESLRLDRQAERARQLLALVPVFGAAGWRLLDEATETANRALNDGDFELTAIISALLEALCSAGFDRTVFGLLNDEHTSIRGRLASGGVVEDVLSRFDFSVDRLDGPIRAALRYKSDVLIDCARDSRYDRSALVTAMGPAAFALFPIVVDHKPVGCLYADRQSAAPALDSARLPLGRVRDVIAAAIRKKSLHSARALDGPAQRVS